MLGIGWYRWDDHFCDVHEGLVQSKTNQVVGPGMWVATVMAFTVSQHPTVATESISVFDS